MRKRFILLASTVLIFCIGYSATNPQSAFLSFYTVSEERIEGGRLIDTLDFPKLGYISARPDLVVTQLVAVSETVSHSFTLKSDKDGKLIQTPLPDQPALTD
jgi:hypothetical protein